MKNSLTLFLPAFALTFFACSTSSESETGTEGNLYQEFHFEVVDSLVVDALEVLVALDYNPENDTYLLKEQREGNVYVVNSKGEILESRDLGGEGPNQAGTFMEGTFTGMDGFVFKELSPTMDFHQYDSDFQKVKVHQGAALGLNALVIDYYRQTFEYLTMEGKPYLFGEEINGYEGGEIKGDKIGAEFYERATTGFLIDLSQDSLQRFTLFADDWKAKKEGAWIGNSLPSISFDHSSQTAFVLPSKGNQLSFYKLGKKGLVFEKSIELLHPDRDDAIPNPDQDGLTYPSLDNVRNLGEYQLVSFNTAVPEDILNGIKAKAGEEYYRDPEFSQAVKTYRKERFILIKEGKQVGVINGTPEEGRINLGLPDGKVLVKAGEGEEERDYNLFYVMKLVRD
ncbi:hypothetical protein [Algoriphagus vanfongensis]|uniref:hypothetical protein n=1 Tax=Algoriphagus vanfongensis TaxID=426371 RepID=UPI000427230D|nr:hypothetical protein [Algoriphagus vanfongensis]